MKFVSIALKCNVVLWILSPWIFLFLKLNCTIEPIMLRFGINPLGLCIDYAYDWALLVILLAGCIVTSFFNFDRDK